MKVYYRLSTASAGGVKHKIKNATKTNCLTNCISVFGVDNITVIGDNLSTELKMWVEDNNLRLVEVKNGSGAATFRSALDIIYNECDDSELVYLLEDDFLHKNGSPALLTECLQAVDCYATLYDHPDKYMEPNIGGNPAVQDGGEVTRVITTDSKHWKITNSTVMSFAASVSRLKQDRDILYKYSQGRLTDSYGMFTELSQKYGIPVMSCIPGHSTHCEQAWLTPFTEWEKI